MALYEGLSAEKLAVVLDIGARYTKFGFIGEFSPRCIIPTEIYCSRSEKIRKIFDYENDQDLYALLVAFIHKLYFRHVLVSPKDRHVVVVESLLCPTQFRDTLASVFYRHYEVSFVEHKTPNSLHDAFQNVCLQLMSGMYMSGDTCLEDEGAPLFCPWFGIKNSEDVGWGALLGHMSGKMGNCIKTQVPSMFSLIWLSYSFITRVTRIYWPPPGHKWIVPLEDGANDYEQELQ